MKGKYLRSSGLVLAVLILPGIVTFFSASAVEAQRRGRVIFVRPRIYRPWGWGFRPWGYNPYNDYYSRYHHYIFDNSEDAFEQGHKDGLKTGQGDAKNRRTYNAQRSHYYKEAGFGNFGELYRSAFLRGYADGFRS